MMFSRQQGTNAFKIFKWKRRGESSLSERLLNNVPPEIELSGYYRAPSPDSESPSGLLNGESFCVDPIPDLDLFFVKLYSYHCEKGLWCIIIKWIVELLSLAFTICFSGFFLLIVDWNGLRNAKCGMDAVESGIKPCDLAKEALHQHPLTPFTLPKAIIVGHLGIFSIYWVFCFLRFFAQLKETLKIRRFYQNSLGVTDDELQTMPWPSVLEKVVQLQTMQQLCVVRDLSAQDVVMRLMRKENYLIGMVNKGVLAFPVFQCVPGVGPVVKTEPNGTQHCLVLTKTLEWTLNWCVLQSMFDRNFRVRTDFIADPKTLKKRLMLVGLGMLLLSPFLVIFMLVYLFLRHAEQFYHHPSTASSRRWSNLSKWMFREFNEVDHLFKHRINSSVAHGSDYLNQFPAPMLTIIAKFISFVSGGFAAILLIIAFLEESLLEGHIYGRNLLWYAAVFGTITAISRAAVSDDLLVFDPQGAMSLVVQHTHYMPKRWRGKENTDYVRKQFETLFQYTGMMLLEEMASIFLTPYLLLFVVPERVDAILQFITDFTVDVEGVGHVCSFSLFDFKRHGNSKYGSPHNVARTLRSSQGKMEKSFLSFRSTYPSWEPDAQGKQFLSTIKTFREQKFQGHGTRRGYSTPRLQQYTPNFRAQTDPNDRFCGEMDSMWLIDSDQKNYPYILDWYYTSQPQYATTSNPKNPEDNEPAPFDDGVSPRNVWVPPTMAQDEPPYDENWGSLFGDRSRSHLDASTSAPLFQKSVLQQHHDFGNVAQHTRSHWWARGGPQAAQPQTSFLEPPNFNRPRVETQSSFLEPPNFNRPQVEEPQSSFLEPPDFNRPQGVEMQTNFLEPTNFNHSQEVGPQTSFLEPPNFNRPQGLELQTNFFEPTNFNHSQEVGPQTSFLEPPNFNRPQGAELQTNFFEPTNFNSSQEVGAETSFLEPPNFNQNNYNNFYDNMSDRSLEEQEQHLDWRSSNRLSRTFYMDDLEGGDFNLPFDDIYSRHSQSPDRNQDPENLV